VSGPRLAELTTVADELQRRVPALSRRVIEDMYRNPFWIERFGVRGRGNADQDGGYHVSYLVEAVRSGSPSVMTRYAQWLRSVLVSRGMCTRHLADNFTRLADAIAAEEEPTFTIAVDLLRQSEAALLYEPPAPRTLQLQALTLARATAVRLRGDYPDWYQESDTGWRRCQDDLLYHLSYLADAVAASRTDLFTGYVRFVAGFLQKRGVPTSHLDATLETLATKLQAAGAPADEGLPLLRAAQAALTGT